MGGPAADLGAECRAGKRAPRCAKIMFPSGERSPGAPAAESDMALLRSSFIALSKNKSLRRFSEHSSLGTRLSSRFVAGLEIEDALRVCEAVNRQGMSVTLDSLGESVTEEPAAHRAADVYHKLLDAIAQRKLNANVSVKLTQMGLELDHDLAGNIALDLTRHAASLKNFVRIDMEDSSLTQITLDIVRGIHAEPGLDRAIGVVIQAYLYRSQADIEQLVADGIRVRLCKGAYKEPPEVAFPRKADVDANYVKLSGMLLSSSIYHGLATHDEKMIEAARQYARSQRIPPDRYEFQMLYGVRRDLQRELVREGYNVRVYIPFGREWYPYFMRRLAERPANVLFLAKNMLRS
jgi:proline dehydrogenase